MDQLSGNVTQLLESFGSMSVDGINSTLQMLKANVTYANQIFSSGGASRFGKETRTDQQGKYIKLPSICIFRF